MGIDVFFSMYLVLDQTMSPKESTDGLSLSDSPHGGDFTLHLVPDIPYRWHQGNPHDPSCTVIRELNKVAHVVAAVRRLLEEAAWFGAMMSGRKTADCIWVDGVDEGIDTLFFLLVGYGKTAAQALRVHCWTIWIACRRC